MSSGLAFFAAGVALGAAVGWGLAALRARKERKVRARLLSFVAHEVNTPVSALNMTVLNFVNGVFGPVPEEHMPWIVLIREQVARLNALVGDLRDLIHVEFHRDLQLNREQVSLPGLAVQALEGMTEALSRSGAEVDNRIPPDLPPMDADPERIGRVVNAVLTHARKFRVSGPVVLSGGAGPGGVEFHVEYLGRKVPREQVARALDLFYPVHNPGSQVLASVGVGLGLPCRIVHAHGGKMSLTVDEKGYCRISVTLPRWTRPAAG